MHLWSRGSQFRSFSIAVTLEVYARFTSYRWSCTSLQGGHALWKTEMVKKNSLQGKIREFEILLKIREKSGNLKNLIFVRSKYSNLIAVQMWLLVVSFCLILLKGGVLVRWSTCLLYILFFLFLIPKSTFHCKHNVCH